MACDAVQPHPPVDENTTADADADADADQVGGDGVDDAEVNLVAGGDDVGTQQTPHPPPPTNKSWRPSKKTLALVGGGLVVGAMAPPLFLYWAGFSSSGVVAGSMAAAWQSSIGNVAAGSAFAAMQSAGVLGVATSTTVAASAAGGGAGFVAARATRPKDN